MNRIKTPWKVALTLMLQLVIAVILTGLNASILRESREVIAEEQSMLYIDGEGIAENPYYITTAEQLITLARYMNLESTEKVVIANKEVTAKDLRNSHYKLTNDIHLNTKDFIPTYNKETQTIEIQIGSQKAYMDTNGSIYADEQKTEESRIEINRFTPICNSSNQFNGSFNGDGYTVYGMVVCSTENYSGMFGYIGTGTVKNMTLKNSIVIGANYTAAIAGASNGEIMNCYAQSIVIGNNNVGGIVGINNGRISNSANTGEIKGKEKVGGISGASEGIAVNCFNIGQVSGTKYVGAILGYSSDPILSKCYYEKLSAKVEGGAEQTGIGTKSGEPRKEVYDGEYIAVVSFDTSANYYTYANGEYTKIGVLANRPLAQLLNEYVNEYNEANGNTLNKWIEKEYYSEFAEKEIPKTESTITLNQSFINSTNITVYTTDNTIKLLPHTTRTGYTFLGYYTVDGEQITDTEGKVWNNILGITDEDGKWIGGSIELYVKWEANRYTIIYDGIEEVGTASYDKDFILTDKYIAKEGYVFIGWEYSIDGITETARTKIPKENINRLEKTQEKTLVLKATYTKREYTVNFSKGDNLTQVYIATEKNAEAGNASGCSYEYMSSLYLIIELKPESVEYCYKAPQGFLPLGGRYYYMSFSIENDIDFGELNATKEIQSYSVSAVNCGNIESASFEYNNNTYDYTNTFYAAYGSRVTLVVKVKATTNEYEYRINLTNPTKRDGDTYYYDFVINGAIKFNLFAEKTQRQYSIDFIKGENIAKMYLQNNLPSGSTFKYGSRVTITAILEKDTDYYTYSLDGYNYDANNGRYTKTIEVGSDIDLGTVNATKTKRTVVIYFSWDSERSTLVGETELVIGKGEPIPIPQVIPKPNFIFTGWSSDIPEIALENNTYRAIVLKKKEINLDKQQQAYVYDASPKAFVINNTQVENVNVEYYYNGGWNTLPPTDANLYDIRCFCEETAQYASLDYVIEGGLEIKQKSLTVNYTVSDKVYDNNNYAEITAISLDGIISNDDITLTATASFPSINVGKHIPDLSYILTGKDSANYAVAQINTTAASITRLTLRVTADDIITVEGEEQKLTYTVDGLLGDDTLSGSLTREEGTSCGYYNILIGTLYSDNYVIDFIPAIYTVNAKTIQVQDDDISAIINTDKGFSPNAVVEVAQINPEEYPLNSDNHQVLYAFDILDYNVSDYSHNCIIKVKVSSDINVNNLSVVSLNQDDAVENFYFLDGYLIIHTSAIGSFAVIYSNDNSPSIPSVLYYIFFSLSLCSLAFFYFSVRAARHSVLLR